MSYSSAPIALFSLRTAGQLARRRRPRPHPGRFIFGAVEAGCEDFSVWQLLLVFLPKAKLLQYSDFGMVGGCVAQ